jgi:hypothetical protein
VFEVTVTPYIEALTESKLECESPSGNLTVHVVNTIPSQGDGFQADPATAQAIQRPCGEHAGGAPTLGARRGSGTGPSRRVSGARSCR